MPLSELQRLALRWVPGNGAVQLHPLARGLTSESYRVDRGGRRYVMRVTAEAAHDLGVDLEWECKAQACAAEAGLAPAIECCEVRDRVLISRWVECRAWTAEEARLPASLDSFGRLLRRVHALSIPPRARTMSPGAWIRQYDIALDRLDRAHSRRSRELRVTTHAMLERLAAMAPVPAVLCHSDLHRFNVAVGADAVEISAVAEGPADSQPRLWLLDWEYAHVADPYWDLAGWAANNDWTLGAVEDWLEAYLGRPAVPEEARRLSLWVWLFDYVCLQWSELYLSRAGEEAVPGVRERLETVWGRLAGGPGGRAEQLPAN